MSSIILKNGREKSLARRHPWIFSGAVTKVEDLAGPGETVEIRSGDGTWLARGAYSPHSQIIARVWTFDPEEDISAAFFKTRLAQAIRARRGGPPGEPRTACRLVNAESDALPGLIVDRYGDYLVCQFLAAGVERWRADLVAQLAQLVPCAGIYERSDAGVRTKEGLPHRTGVLYGQPPPDLLEIQEGRSRFLVDVRHGHKTGFYLDQRENRMLVADWAEGAEVLNAFAYTGGFGLWALMGGAAQVVNVDSSVAALELLRRHVLLNGLDPSRVENLAGDAFQLLRRFRDSGRQFDLIILDPPKFAESRRQLARSGRGYKDINLLAFKLLRPGGLLFTFSCSGLVSMELFQKFVADAALDAGRTAQIVRRLGQPDDHPTALNFPEGTYLKGLVCRVI
ncbi:MAG: class I SAM-dependent methyltransferase [Desulfobacterales bacterium]|nr:MAG: class I SAM-dependent methyltransferase [Desulfobacterales bacterium]